MFRLRQSSHNGSKQNILVRITIEPGEAQQGKIIKTTTDRGDEGMDTRGSASSRGKA